MGAEILSTSNKVLNIVKEMNISIRELVAISSVCEDTLLNIMAGISEADINTLYQIADVLGVCVRELCPDQERYMVPVEKNTLAKLIVVSEISGVELDALVASILKKGIEGNGFYD